MTGRLSVPFHFLSLPIRNTFHKFQNGRHMSCLLARTNKIPRAAATRKEFSSTEPKNQEWERIPEESRDFIFLFFSFLLFSFFPYQGRWLAGFWKISLSFRAHGSDLSSWQWQPLLLMWFYHPDDSSEEATASIAEIRFLPREDGQEKKENKSY